MIPFTLYDFVRESNRIEGIVREPLEKELVAHREFLRASFLSCGLLEGFVAMIQLNARLRIHPHMDVRVGNHFPPKGGPEIAEKLEYILTNVRSPDSISQCSAVHCQYESLHPFTDGNGRSGRAIWLWMMGGIEKAPLGFLHTFYYQKLGRNP